MDQIFSDIAALVGNSTVTFNRPIEVTSENVAHFLIGVNRYQFWISVSINGAPDLLNKFCHPLQLLDQYTLERVLGSIQVSH